MPPFQGYPCNYGALPQASKSDLRTKYLDWKIIAIDVNDPLESKLLDIHDVDASFPGYLNSLKTWYKQYKIPDGKPENAIALGEALQDRRYVVFVPIAGYISFISMANSGIDLPFV